MADVFELEIGRKIDQNFGYILGVLCGDGFLDECRIGLHVKDKDFALNFRNVGEKAFGLSGKLGLYNSLWRVRFNSRRLAKLFKIAKDTSNYIDIIEESETSVKCAFLRGMFDSEGSAYFRKDYGRSDRKIELCNTNYSLLAFCADLLEKIDIRICKIDKRVREERILKGRLLPITIFYRFTLKENRENFVKFRNFVGFSIKRKQDKLNTIIDSYLETKSKWGNLRKEVLESWKRTSYSEIIKEFHLIPRGTIDRWLSEYNQHRQNSKT